MGSAYLSVLEDGNPERQSLYHTSGAVLLGGMIALFLSGAVFMQAVLYGQRYQTDPAKTKCMVVLIWTLDLVHSAMVLTANWQNLIVSFGRYDKLDYITWSIAVTVALTATTTFLVHCFFSHRIHTLSRGNWYITVPLVTLACVRLVAATVSTAEMIRLESYIQFVKRYDYVFTLGLSASTSLDILITGALCYYLRQRKSGLARMDRIIDLLTLYTVENGMLTYVTTVVSLICVRPRTAVGFPSGLIASASPAPQWVKMPQNLIFLGLHLAISKLYANSFMASLNARKSLSSRSEGSGNSEGYPMPVVFPSMYSPRSPQTPWSPRARSTPALGKRLEVGIDIEQTVHRETLRQSRKL